MFPELARIDTFNFGQPWWLALLALVPLLAWVRGRRGGGAPAVQYSSAALVRGVGIRRRSAYGGWPVRLASVALALACLAMARPRMERGESPDKREGVDVVFCIDVSGSMDNKDFAHKGQNISRRDALVLAIGDFVDKRPTDRFGMIGFATNTYLMSPMTLDGQWIKDVLKSIQTQRGTAVGEGVLSATELFKVAKGKSKIMILVTDGESNAGIDPLKAAEVAKAAGVRIHAIAITKPQAVGADAAIKSQLGKVAERTGGLYFQAASLESMLGVYRQIDRMEKSKFEQLKQRTYTELFPWFVAPALALLLIGWIGGHTWWIRLP